VNRTISTREIYGVGFRCCHTQSTDTTTVRCDDSSLSSSFAPSFHRLITLLLQRPTFQSKAIDEVANSRRLTIPWITGENSPNCTLAGRQTVFLNVANKIIPADRSSPFSLSSNSLQLCLPRRILPIFLSPSEFFYFFFPRERERESCDDMRVKLDIALPRNNFLFNASI